jgi:PhoPQ-activated pathogenicity-related protein
MHRRLRTGACLVLVALQASVAAAEPLAVVSPSEKEAKLKATIIQTPLDRYIAQPDPTYSWKLVSRVDKRDFTALILDLKSQTWRKPEEVDRTLWQHWMCITIPKAARADMAMLVIRGGDNGDEPPEGPSGIPRQVALATGSIVVELMQVPNQPLELRGDGKDRYEDDLVARSWTQCLATGDPQWIVQFPMTKAAVRAMDAAQAALQKHGFPKISKFVVTGGSKRGWATWLAAAVDPRVAAIAPSVIDVVNMQPSMKNHHAAYGFWAQSLSDYESQGLTTFYNTPLSTVLLGLVDPYAFRARLTMPKCIINATGDQYFTPDSSKFYFDALPGEKLLYYVPNSDHSLADTDALDTLIAFHASVLQGLPRPKIKWSLDDDGAWRVSSDLSPKRVLLWQAVNDEARDFRVQSIGKAFTSTELAADAKGDYVGAVPAPKKGYAAYVVQLEYDIGAPAPLRVSTPVQIVPDTLPFAK